MSNESQDDKQRSESIETTDDYAAPEIETVVTPETLEREVQYGGTVTPPPV